MIVVILVTLIAILLTNMESHGRLGNGMFWGFVLVTFLGCIHYDYGNDYLEYLQIYKEITSIPLRFDYLWDNTYRHEFGWVLLNYLFSHLGGFYVMVAVLNIIQNAIYYSFIKDNVPQTQWTLAVVIYLMSGSLYIMNFSMMRQGLAIALFVWAWSFMKDKKLIPSLLIVAAAYSVHQSALILLPFVFFPYLKLKRGTISIIYIGLLIGLYLSSGYLSDTYNALLELEELQEVDSSNKLQYYDNNNTETLSFGLGFFLNLIPFIIALWGLFVYPSKEPADGLDEQEADEQSDDELRYIDRDKRLLIVIAIVSFMITPFGMLLPMMTRLGMYFEALGVAAIPAIYSLLPNKLSYRILLGIYLFMLLYNYYGFFTSEVWGEKYSTFHTVFQLFM